MWIRSQDTVMCLHLPVHFSLRRWRPRQLLQALHPVARSSVEGLRGGASPLLRCEYARPSSVALQRHTNCPKLATCHDPQSTLHEIGRSYIVVRERRQGQVLNTVTKVALRACVEQSDAIRQLPHLAAAVHNKGYDEKHSSLCTLRVKSAHTDIR